MEYKFNWLHRDTLKLTLHENGTEITSTFLHRYFSCRILKYCGKQAKILRALTSFSFKKSNTFSSAPGSIINTQLLSILLSDNVQLGGIVQRGGKILTILNFSMPVKLNAYSYKSYVKHTGIAMILYKKSIP